MPSLGSSARPCGHQWSACAALGSTRSRGWSPSAAVNGQGSHTGTVLCCCRAHRAVPCRSVPFRAVPRRRSSSGAAPAHPEERGGHGETRARCKEKAEQRLKIKWKCHAGSSEPPAQSRATLGSGPAGCSERIPACCSQDKSPRLSEPGARPAPSRRKSCGSRSPRSGFGMVCATISCPSSAPSRGCSYRQLLKRNHHPTHTRA